MASLYSEEIKPAARDSRTPEDQTTQDRPRHGAVPAQDGRRKPFQPEHDPHVVGGCGDRGEGDAGNRPQRPAEGEGKEDHPIHGNSREHGRPPAGGHGPHGLADQGPLEEIVQSDHDGERDAENPQALGHDGGAEKDEGGFPRQRRQGHGVLPPDKHDQTL